MDHEKVKKEIENSLDELFDEDGNSFSFYKYKDVIFPPVPLIPEVMSKLHLLPVHKDDIFLCAYPCSGTHWMWEVTSMILNNKAERIPGVKEEFMLEFTPPEKLEDKVPPRLFNTHVQPKFLPQNVLSQNKILFVVRNPKDTCVSSYKHLFGLQMANYHGTFPRFFEWFMENKLTFGCYFDYMTKWWPVIKDNPNCLLISYEEASQDLVKTVNKIGHFLGRPLTPELSENIAKLCTFDRMKEEKLGTMPDVKKSDFWKPGYSFYRKGKVATWKEWLTVSQSERIDACVKQELSDCGIQFTYSLPN